MTCMVQYRTRAVRKATHAPTVQGTGSHQQPSQHVRTYFSPSTAGVLSSVLHDIFVALYLPRWEEPDFETSMCVHSVLSHDLP